ncbi:MAG: hypothetical protein ACRD0K_08985 [Egibacteraceae bacterium]
MVLGVTGTPSGDRRRRTDYRTVSGGQEVGAIIPSEIFINARIRPKAFPPCVTEWSDLRLEPLKAAGQFGDGGSAGGFDCKGRECGKR